MKDKKILIRILLEKDRLFQEEFNDNQKLRVIINKVISEMGLTDSESRILRREDGSELPDYDKTIEETGIYNGETLRFYVKAPKPDRDKGFA